MGREALAQISFAGQTGEGKILLESSEVIVRGEIRLRLPRHDITDFAVDADDLVLTTPNGPLRATMGASQALAWIKALAKPLPSLAQKLGVGPQTPCCVISPIADAQLAAALDGCIVADAPLHIAELYDLPALEAALDRLALHPDPVFWGVVHKGKSAVLTDAVLRSRMRAAGYIDTKSCAVSNTHSATRYARR